MPAKNNTLKTVTDIAMVAFIMFFPHYGGLPMYAFPFVVLGVVWIYLNLTGESFDSIGFRFRDLNVRTFWLGGTIGLLYAAFAYWVLGPFITHVLGFKGPNFSDFAYLRHHLLNYILLLLMAAFLVIPFEEIAFRGFIFSRFRNMFHSKWPYLLSGLITSALFALYHFQEGKGAMLGIFIFALFITWLYKIFKGNLWYLIFFHVMYDVFFLTAIWLGHLK